MTLTVGNYAFDVDLEQNTTAKTLLQMLPFETNMSELNGNEKYFYLDKNLPASAQKIGNIKTGDIMLYGKNCLVIFYKSFSSSYSYTKVGHIKDVTNLQQALGNGDVQVSWNV